MDLGGANKSHSKFWAFDLLTFQGKQQIPFRSNDESIIWLIVIHIRTKNDQGLLPSRRPLRLLKIIWKANTAWLASEVSWVQRTLMLTLLLEMKMQQYVLLWPSDTVGEWSLWKDEYNSTQWWEQVTPASDSHLNSHLVSVLRWTMTFSHWVMPAIETEAWPTWGKLVLTTLAFQYSNFSVVEHFTTRSVSPVSCSTISNASRRGCP